MKPIFSVYRLLLCLGLAALPQAVPAQLCFHGTTVGQVMFSTNCNGQLIFGKAHVGSTVGVLVRTSMADECPLDQTLVFNTYDQIQFRPGESFTTSNLVAAPILLPSLGSVSNITHIKSGVFSGAAYTYVVPENAAQYIRHTITAVCVDTNSSTNPGGILGAVGSAQLEVLRPHLTLTTTCTNLDDPGDTVSFSGTLSNDGNTELTNIFLLNNQPTNNAVLLGPFTLAEGEIRYFSGTFTSSSTPATLTAFGTDPLLCEISAVAPLDCSLIPGAALRVTKACASPIGTNVGSSLTVTGLVCNTGQILFTNVIIVDAQPGIPTSATNLLGSLDPGQCKPYSFTFTATSCATNHDTVSVFGFASGGVVTTNASADCLLCCPGITVEKTIACLQPGALCPANAADYRSTATGVLGNSGDPILDNPAFCYRILVRNTGQDPLNNIVVRDEALGVLQTFAGPLAVGASFTIENLRTNWASTTTNGVIVSGQCAGARGNGALVSASSAAIAVVLPANLVCQKLLASADDLDLNGEDAHVTLPQDGAVHLVTNSVRVCNTGSVDLTAVTITDPKLQSLGCPMPAPFNLPTGQCATVVLCVQAITADANFCSTNFLSQAFVTAQADPGTNHFCVLDRAGSNLVVVGMSSSRIDCELRRGCAGTPGYWITHPQAWPVEQLTVGGVGYNQAAALSLLQLAANNTTNLSLALFSHLVSAKLNAANGAAAGCIRHTLDAADGWLQTHGPIGGNIRPGTQPWKRGEPLRKHLERYNNSALCAKSGC